MVSAITSSHLCQGKISKLICIYIQGKKPTGMWLTAIQCKKPFRATCSTPSSLHAFHTQWSNVPKVVYAGFFSSPGAVLTTLPYAWFSCTTTADSAYSFVLRLHTTITAIRTTPRITPITAPTATPANTPTDRSSPLPEDELVSSVGSGTGVGVSIDADNGHCSLKTPTLLITVV